MEIFRLATPKDSDAVWATYRAAARSGRDNGSSEWDEVYPDRAVLDEDVARGRLFVLERDRCIVASVALLESDHLDAEPVGWTPLRSCVPVRLCVAPAHQCQGLGERVMRLLAAHAKAAGYAATRHMAAIANPAAIRLYQRMGYRAMGRVHLYDTEFMAYEMLL